MRDSNFCRFQILLTSIGLWLLPNPLLAQSNLTSQRAGHTATLLSSGQVLITGGVDQGGNPLASAELYDPSTKTSAATGSMSSAREHHTATLLLDGTVLITGGEQQVRR